MTSKRDLSLDFTKAILVSLMIVSHTFAFLSPSADCVHDFRVYVKLTTFSGFFFVFGCTIYLAYFAKKVNMKRKIGKGVLRILIVYFISAFSMIMLIEKDHSLSRFIRILFLCEIPGWCEFLISFALLLPIAYLLRHTLDKITDNWRLTALAVLFSFMSTFIPYQYIKPTQIELLIGGLDGYLFPVLQYSSFFVVGFYCQKHGSFRKRNTLLLAVFAMLVSLGFIIKTDILLYRFPPRLPWVLFGFLPILLYKEMGRLLGHYALGWVRSLLTIGGKYTLDYLLISNLTLFTLKHYKVSGGIGFSFLIAISILFCCLGYGKLRTIMDSRAHSVL